jgi:hypothetical protein
MRTLCYMVGDAFAAFANGVRVLTASQLRQRLCDAAVDWREIDLDRGLGLGADECQLVRTALVEACAPPATLDRFRQERAALRMTHKRPVLVDLADRDPQAVVAALERGSEDQPLAA